MGDDDGVISAVEQVAPVKVTDSDRKQQISTIKKGSQYQSEKRSRYTNTGHKKQRRVSSSSSGSVKLVESDEAREIKPKKKK